MLRKICFALAVLALFAGPALSAEDLLASLKKGTPELKSAGALAFGPQGILFVGDTQAATIYAFDTGDRTAPTSNDRPKVQAIDEKIANMLGTEAKELQLSDLAVNPISGNTYLAVARGKGPTAKPVLIRVERTGKIGEFALKDVPMAKAALPNANEKRRAEAITQIAYTQGKVYVAGLSSEEFASNLRAIPFPFTEANKGTGIEIYHGSHGRVETASPIRTFTPFDVKGEPYILAAYTCTPLVKIPVSQLKPGEKVKGVTIAELGNRNVPRDMIVYQKGGKDYLLMANSSRGVMKIPTDGIDTAAPITAQIKDKAGVKYETITALKGVVQLDRFDKDHALVLVRTDSGLHNLETTELP
jgi:hypothetical protein